jgi:hypothetical protein
LQAIKGGKQTLVALESCWLAVLARRTGDFEQHVIDDDNAGFSGHLGMLAQRLQWNESHTAQSFSSIDF